MSDAARDAILENRIYRNLSGALAGVADYMAMEKLLELAANPDTDLIVLDTPPATEAIDFLDAPRRLLELLNSRAISLLGAPAGLFKSQLRMVDIAARAVLAAFDRVTGLNLLSDVQSFVRSFDGMYEGFSTRAARAQDKLRAADTAIVIVTTAESSRIAQAREFVGALEGAGLRVSAMVVNRVLAELPDAARTGLGAHRAVAQEKVEAQSRRLCGAQDARGSFAGRAARIASRRRGADGRAGPRPRAAHNRGPRRDRPQHPRRLISRTSSRDEPRASVSGFVVIEHAIELDAEVQQLRAQMVEPRFQVAHVALGRDIDEVEHLLDVAVERLLVRHEAFTRLAETRAHPVVRHDLVEKAGDAFFAHLAELVHQVVVCRRVPWLSTIYRGSRRANR